MSGITLKETADGSIPSPAADKKTIFFDTDGLPKYKDEGGTVTEFATGAILSPPFSDATGIVKGSVDATKIVRIEADGLTTATTRVLTPPDANITIAGLEVQQAFTKNQRVTPVALVDGANIAVDASLSNNFKVTLGGNRTLDNPTNLSDGMVFNIVIKQDGTGNRTLAYGSKWSFPGGTAPVLSTAANAKDMMSCYYDSGADELFCVMNKAFS